jgi:hypothetical protein
MAGNAALRIRQNTSRSAGSRATRTSSAPATRHSCATSSKRASISAAGPSSSTISAAPASAGQPARAICSDASIESESIISIAPGTTPAATISDTAWPACAGDPKKATSVCTDSGVGTTRSVTLVATPSVPSDPTNTPCRS